MDTIKDLNVSFWKQFTLSSALWLIPLILISSYVSYSVFTTRIDILNEKQAISVHVAAHDIKHIIANHVAILNIFYNDINDQIQNDTLDLDHISLKWLSFIKNQTHYDQMRILDNTGMEIVRVNFNSGHPSITSKAQLQNKSNRYYFKDVIPLNAGEIYISPLDLNRDHGKIEQPLKPMIRYAVPFNDKSGQKGGVIIFNYLAEELISAIKKINSQYPSKITLLNNDGYFLFNHDESKEWGFMYGNNFLFQNEYPDVWDRLLKENKGQIKIGNQYFSFMAIYPYKISRHAYKWFLVSHLPSATVKNILYQEIRSLLPIIGIALIILLLIIWKLTKLKIKQSHFVNNLEMMVTERTEELAKEIEIRKKMENKFRKMASYDELTGLSNRMLFIDRLNLSMSLARRSNRQLALLFIDLDGFKEVNDTYGHNSGDLLLKQVSNRLLSSVRESDLVGRIGGDEFLVLLQNSMEEDEIAHIAQHIIKTLADVFMIKGEQICISSSIGIAIFKGDDESSELLLERADKAMYEVKESGKNGFRISGITDSK